jgi:integral membrane protein (TIGR01906 family)
MGYFKRLAGVLLVASVPVLLISASARLVINLPLLYSYGFDRYDIPYWTGIERDELLSAGAQIRDYFNNDEEWLDLQVVHQGVRRRVYDQGEVGHMKDVKGLVRGVYLVQWLTLAYVVAFGGVGLAVRGRRFLPRLGRLLGIGGLATVGLVAAAGLASVAGFERVFLAFHLVSFRNDLWQSDGFLVTMFPQGFFFDATMWIAGLTVAGAVVLALVPAYVLGWRPIGGSSRVADVEKAPGVMAT